MRVAVGLTSVVMLCGWMGKVVGGRKLGPGDTDDAGEIECVVRLESIEYDAACVGGGENSWTGLNGSENPWPVGGGPNWGGKFSKMFISTPYSPGVLWIEWRWARRVTLLTWRSVCTAALSTSWCCDIDLDLDFGAIVSLYKIS